MRRNGRGNRHNDQRVDFFRCFRLLGRTTGQAAAVLGVLTGTASAFTDVPIGPIAEAVLGTLAAGLLGFHLLNFELRGFLGHWSIKELHRPLHAEFVLGCCVPAGVLEAIFASSPNSSLLLGVCAALLVSYGIYEPVQETIQREVKRKHLPQGTDYFGSLRPLGFFGIDKSIEVIAKDKHGPNLQSLLAFFVGRPWLGGLSRTRTVILCALLIGFCMAGAAAGEVHLQEAVRPSDDPAPKEKKDSEAKRSEGLASAGETATGTDSGDAPGEAGRCSFLPSDGAPGWARKEMNALYLGHRDFQATPPPGFDIGGCTSGATVEDGGRFVYAVGKDEDGETLSVAVDSRRFGPAIFLAPAAQRVLAMIEQGQTPLGGYRKRDVGGGDMVPILTRNGTIVLIRSAKHPPDKPTYATPYLELPVTGATAWMEAMSELDTWLWPTDPVEANGSRLFSLQGATEAGSVTLELSIDPTTGIARRGRYTYRVPENQVSQEELEERAGTAPYFIPAE